LLFFLLSPPTPTSTIFPYTTLFRSLFDQPDRLMIEVGPGYIIQGKGRIRNHLRKNAMGLNQQLIQGGCVAVDIIDKQYLFSAMLDRKSTRLNSSHLGISYAVFCLKK